MNHYHWGCSAKIYRKTFAREGFAHHRCHVGCSFPNNVGTELEAAPPCEWIWSSVLLFHSSMCTHQIEFDGSQKMMYCSTLKKWRFLNLIQMGNATQVLKRTYVSCWNYFSYLNSNNFSLHLKMYQQCTILDILYYYKSSHGVCPGLYY